MLISRVLSLAVWVAVLLIALGIACASSTNEPGRVNLLENVESMRRDPGFQQIERELRAEYKRCVEDLGKTICLSTFLEQQEKQMSACLLVFVSENQRRLCTLQLEAIADDHGWTVRKSDRKIGLLKDKDVESYHRDCVLKVDDFNCFSRFYLLQAYKYDICADIWGGRCGEIIGELLAAAQLETE